MIIILTIQRGENEINTPDKRFSIFGHLPAALRLREPRLLPPSTDSLMISVFGKALVPRRNSRVNKPLYSAVNLGILRRVEIVDVARELHSSVFLESQVCWQPLIPIRPEFWWNSRTTSMLRAISWLNNVVFPVIGRSFSFASP